MPTTKFVPALGYLPDAPKGAEDKPDWNAAELLGAVPPPGQGSCRKLIYDILNQGQLGSCTCNAVFQAVRASHIKQGINFPKLGSRLFGYYLARAYQHMTGLDAGTQLRLVFDALNKFGFCPEEEWPYSDALDEDAPFKKMPSSTAFQKAYDQKAPTTYRRIFETKYARIDAIKRAVSQGFVVCFGTDVSKDFVDGQLGTGPLPPPVGQEIVGGHAMCVAEYDGDKFGIVNSWGYGFGQDGWCQFSADYLAWDRTRDLWIVEHAPKYSDEPRQ